MFDRCSFILGDNDSIIIVVPTSIPKDAPLKLEVHDGGISFFVGERNVSNVDVVRPDILKRLSTKLKVGLIDSFNDQACFPAYISLVADIHVTELAA